MLSYFFFNGALHFLMLQMECHAMLQIFTMKFKSKLIFKKSECKQISFVENCLTFLELCRFSLKGT